MTDGRRPTMEPAFTKTSLEAFGSGELQRGGGGVGGGGLVYES